MIIDIDIFVDRIGFNVFSIKNQQRKEILEDKIIIPVSFDICDKLSYIRKFMLVLLNQYNIEKSYLHTNDDFEFDINNIDIIKITGVIEELLSSCGVELCK